MKKVEAIATELLNHKFPILKIVEFKSYKHGVISFKVHQEKKSSVSIGMIFGSWAYDDDGEIIVAIDTRIDWLGTVLI